MYHTLNLAMNHLSFRRTIRLPNHLAGVGLLHFDSHLQQIFRRSESLKQ